MKHIFFIDPLDKLNVKKDSSIMMALTAKEMGYDTFLLFEKDFFYINDDHYSYKLYEFSGNFKKESFYIDNDSFTLTRDLRTKLAKDDIIHMRIDPPFDSRYLRYLWMLKSLTKRGIRVVNSPEGILLHNEKLVAYESKFSLPSFVGTSLDQFELFLSKMKDLGHQFLILKPLDLYQGIGVEKVDVDSALMQFEKKVSELKGPVVAQSFDTGVSQGEVRTNYYAGTELGTIIKIPPKGDFLANIARGATFHPHELSSKQRKICEEISLELMKFGANFIAFDLLGDQISEANVTCPGLLVEVSSAHKKNLAIDILKAIQENH